MNEQAAPYNTCVTGKQVEKVKGGGVGVVQPLLGNNAARERSLWERQVKRWQRFFPHVCQVCSCSVIGIIQHSILHIGEHLIKSKISRSIRA